MRVAEQLSSTTSGLECQAPTDDKKLLAPTLDEDLLVLSQFLHAAATNRISGKAESEEGRAFEGALLEVYQGNHISLATLKNIITGSENKVTDIFGEPLDFTFAQLKQSSIDCAPPLEEVFADQWAQLLRGAP